MSDWIKVEDELPEETVYVLIKQSLCSYIIVGYYSNNTWFENYEELRVMGDAYINNIIEQDKYIKITHWMPLPEPPND